MPSCLLASGLLFMDTTVKRIISVIVHDICRFCFVRDAACVSSAPAATHSAWQLLYTAAVVCDALCVATTTILTDPTGCSLHRQGSLPTSRQQYPISLGMIQHHFLPILHKSMSIQSCPRPTNAQPECSNFKCHHALHSTTICTSKLSTMLCRQCCSLRLCVSMVCIFNILT